MFKIAAYKSYDTQICGRAINLCSEILMEVAFLLAKNSITAKTVSRGFEIRMHFAISLKHLYSFYDYFLFVLTMLLFN